MNFGLLLMVLVVMALGVDVVDVVADEVLLIFSTSTAFTAGIAATGAGEAAGVAAAAFLLASVCFFFLNMFLLLADVHSVFCSDAELRCCVLL